MEGEAWSLGSREAESGASPAWPVLLPCPVTIRALICHLPVLSLPGDGKTSLELAGERVAPPQMPQFTLLPQKWVSSGVATWPHAAGSQGFRLFCQPPEPALGPAHSPCVSLGLRRGPLISLVGRATFL